MKTKTIDKLLKLTGEAIIGLNEKFPTIAYTEITYLNSITTALEKEKKCKEQKKKLMGWFSTKSMEFTPILPDLTKDLERLSKAIYEYNAAIKKQVTPTGKTIETCQPIQRIEELKEHIHQLDDGIAYRDKANEALWKENKELKEEVKILRKDYDPMDINRIYLKDKTLMFDFVLFNGSVEYKDGKAIQINKRTLTI